MKRIVDRGLVALALRRSYTLGVAAWTAVLLALVLFSENAGEARVSDLADPAVSAGLVREGVWLVFVLGLVPLIVVRAAANVAPWRASSQASARHGDAPWLATRAVSNEAIATSTWLGAALAGLALLTVFALAAGLRGGYSSATPVAAGTLDGPEERWAASGAPLSWHAELPDGAERVATSARIQLGLGAGAGVATEVRLRARREKPGTDGAEIVAVARIGNRGAIEVALPDGAGGVDFELACPGEEARVCVLSERVELWSRDAGPHVATLSIAIRLALALCAWLALALGLSPFVSPATAAFAVLAAWVPHWWADERASDFWARFLPGADLFDALAIVGDGRAPAMPAIGTLGGTVILVVLGLVLARTGMRRWRVSR